MKKGQKGVTLHNVSRGVFLVITDTWFYLFMQRPLYWYDNDNDIIMQRPLYWYETGIKVTPTHL